MNKTLGKVSMGVGGIGLASTAFLVATGGMGAAAAAGLTLFDAGLLYAGNRMRQGQSPLPPAR